MLSQQDQHTSLRLHPWPYSLGLLPPCERISESISERSFSIRVRSDSRNIRCEKKASRRSRLRKAAALHCRAADFSLARTEADRGMPHSTANSPKIVPGPASVSTRSRCWRSTKTCILPVRTSRTNVGLSPSLSSTSPGEYSLISPDSNSIRAPSKVNPWNSGNRVIEIAYCSFTESTSVGFAFRLHDRVTETLRLPQSSQLRERLEAPS